MNILHYIQKYKNHPEFEQSKNWFIGPWYSWPNAVNEVQGMIQFTPETSSIWGGPFPDHHAMFVLLDETKRNFRSFELAKKDAREKLLGYISAKTERKGEFVEMLERLEAGDSDVVHDVEECGTAEFPFRIWMMGNDDTSYSKWFRTRKEAEQLLELLEANQPLNFYKDFLPFGWTFTN